MLSEIFDQGDLGQHKFSKHGERAQWLRGSVLVERVCVGRQYAVGDSPEAYCEVNVCMALFRLPGCPGEVLVTFNDPKGRGLEFHCPLGPAPWSEEEFYDFIYSCHIHDSDQKAMVRAVFFALNGIEPFDI